MAPGGPQVIELQQSEREREDVARKLEELRRSNGPAAVGVFVVHNKLKPKKGKLPDDVTYIAGENVPDAWNCYPWDAKAYNRDIFAHEALARQCAGELGLNLEPNPMSPRATVRRGPQKGKLGST